MGPATNRVCVDIVRTQKTCRALHFDWELFGTCCGSNTKNLRFLWYQWSRYYWNFYDATFRLGWYGLQLPKWCLITWKINSWPKEAYDCLKTKLYHLFRLRQLPTCMSDRSSLLISRLWRLFAQGQRVCSHSKPCQSHGKGSFSFCLYINRISFYVEYKGWRPYNRMVCPTEFVL